CRGEVRVAGPGARKCAMRALRTPDDRFDRLPGYPFAPHYVSVAAASGGGADVGANGSALRVHYVDEGKGAPVLMLHGEPTWSYLYRKMIPVFSAAGYRAVAPDLVGFGKSDKPSSQADYSYARHVAWMAEWLEKVDLRDVTLICQDWGSLIGLRLVAEHPD